MKKILSAVLAVAAASVAFAQDTATQTVTYSVSAVNSITVIGTPTLALTDLNAAGTAFEEDTDTATYSLFTNSAGMKITASLDSDMPTGFTLALEMAAPAGTESAGSSELSAAPADLVTDISNVDATDLVMTYTLNADATADAAESGTRTVTFTITDGSI